MEISKIESAFDFYVAVRFGSIEAFHKLERSAYTDQDDAATVLLVLLYMDGADSVLKPNKERAKSIMERATKYLLAFEEKLTDFDNESISDPKSREYYVHLYLLGIFYDLGHGVSKDFAKAFKYIDRSATHKFPAAMNWMGNAYSSDQNGVPLDYGKSLEYYTDAAEKFGYIISYYNLGLAYEYGEGVPVDINKSYEYVEITANAGFPMALQYMLQWCMSHGQTTKAKEFLRKQIEQGVVKAMLKLANMLESEKLEAETDVAEYVILLTKLSEHPSSQASLFHEDVQREVDSESCWNGTFKLAKRYYSKLPGVEPDDKKCFELFSKIYSHRDDPGFQYRPYSGKECAFYIGMAYLYGRGVEENIEEAIQALKEVTLKESLDKYPDANYELGKLYHEGKKVPENRDLAFKYFQKAAMAQHGESLYIYGMYCLEYPEFLDDVNGYKQIHSAAVEHRHVESQYMMGVACVFGGVGGVLRNPSEAFNWFYKAATAGDRDSMYNLGMSYLQGFGVDTDRTKGLEWLEKAAEAGDGDAMYNLALSLLRISLIPLTEPEEILEEEQNRKLVTKEDTDLAKLWLQKAMEIGDVDAERKLQELVT